MSDIKAKEDEKPADNVDPLVMQDCPECTRLLLLRCVDAYKLKRAKERINDLENLLTSARNIAEREGNDVAWKRFSNRIASFGIGSVTAKVFRKLQWDV